MKDRDPTNPEREPSGIPYLPQRAALIAALLFATLLFLVAMPRSTLLALLRGLLAKRILFGLLLFFSLLTLSLLWSAGQQLDALIFLYFNQHRFRKPWLDLVMLVTTQLGRGLFGFTLAVIFFLLGLHRLVIELILGILTLGTVVELIKVITARARPYIAIQAAKIVGWRERGRSFPSGHTAQSFYTMSLLVMYFHPGLLISLGLYSVAALVGFTRVYVGVHYPRDVIAGAVLGIVWSILVGLVDPYLASVIPR
jgi:membrane-associated phospholipid phosphatase